MKHRNIPTSSLFCAFEWDILKNEESRRWRSLYKKLLQSGKRAKALKPVIDNVIATVFHVCFYANNSFCSHVQPPKTFSYNRFIEVMPRCFVAMTMFLKLAVFGKCTGISFVDSTCISVIHNKHFYSMKVHIKSVWEKNEESLLVISYFPHFG